MAPRPNLVIGHPFLGRGRSEAESPAPPCEVPKSETGPLVSIIVPTKNRCALLLDTLASVRNQTYPHWEAIVVDDLSTDNTWPVLLDLAARDPRIRPLRRTGPAGGAPVARNQGFAASSGEFILFLDSDDLLTPTAIAVRLQAASAYPEADAIVCQAEHFTDTPGTHGEETAYRNYVFDGVDPLDAFLAYHAPWYISGPLFRRAAIERIGLWDIDLPFGQDLEYHVRALIAGIRFQRFAYVDQYTRGHEGSRISHLNNFAGMSNRIALLDKLITQLQVQNLLTTRRKQMLAWSAFWGTMGYVRNRQRPLVAPAQALWRAARERGLVSPFTYLAGCILFSRCLKALGPAPSEVARLLFYNHLKRRPLLHPALLRTFQYQLKWALRRRRMRRRAMVT